MNLKEALQALINGDKIIVSGWRDGGDYIFMNDHEICYVSSHKDVSPGERLLSENNGYELFVESDKCVKCHE